ncbi:hypothetical protein C7U57_29040 [Pseudomonas sp. R9.37]|nr:hypothetical protein C7U57_29040 [Pseudomonas sp. R9.37]
MQAPRCIRHTQLMPWQASQLPPLIEYNEQHSSTGCTAIQLWERACSRRRWFSQLMCHSHTAFASKPAPTR